MKKLFVGAAAVALCAAVPALAADKLMEDARAAFKTVASTAPTLKNNTLTPEKVELGKKLYFDPRLSASGLLSCNTCHNLGMGGDDNLETSVGHGWQKGPRNAPTVLNAVFNAAQFWDGRAEDLKAQAKGPIQANVEMNSTPDRVMQVLNSMPQYVAEFKAAFPGDKDAVSFDNVALAIEAFEATLVTPNARFDKYLDGDAAALNDTEKKGLALFLEKGCVTCHNGVNVGGQGYFPFGVVQRPGAETLPIEDRGRFAVTKTAEDDYVFRAGPLRNIELTAPYFHSGKVWSLKQAVAIMGESQLGAKLSEAEINAVTAFLTTLTGQQPKVEYPVLPVSTDKTPVPVLMK